VSVYARGAAHPFHAFFQFKSKAHHICYCPTAEAAARAYDAVACMIPGRKLNFPTTIPAAATSSRQQQGASAPVPPAESDILAAIAAVREARPGLPPRGAVKYFGVYIKKGSACNPYQASIRVEGKLKHIGLFSTAEAAARAHDVITRTIPGHKLNFPSDGSSAAAAAGGSRTAARSLPARGTGQPSHPLRVAHENDGSAAATAASACAPKRKQPSSSSPPRARVQDQRHKSQCPTQQQHVCQKTHSHTSAAQVHHPLQPSQQLPDSAHM
jgi:hypothetical protein